MDYLAFRGGERGTVWAAGLSVSGLVCSYKHFVCSCAFAAGGTQGCFTGSPVPLGRGLGWAAVPAACAGADMQVRCEQRRGAQGETVAQSRRFLACSKGKKVSAAV